MSNPPATAGFGAQSARLRMARLNEPRHHHGHASTAQLVGRTSSYTKTGEL